jgi:hypothetical protein
MEGIGSPPFSQNVPASRHVSPQTEKWAIVPYIVRMRVAAPCRVRHPTLATGDST